ncbi:guanine nucleotide exchange C9orf72 homolog isoform X1 [Sarcophilus harrisii]|uniref:C9orf72-SMCR8 complex subunit n=1 Tax=Sarcophilus harrisii TaxID=9305 RepID=G3VK78_SARHA|nr:guanine nucleotide exchange C9orf72 homolog isoform X1 [Sarcophilus harrisii]XP_031799134.1 guanine nucleotide exchange C9orf72 homolog isoform X1 [Sarcophilus harrisii]XP_031799140.1 guanine nucleotide exchange C9orf72 homolog isoform X1 [Sarcophilus harrisii]XP_031799147.1 guanine nucleotide exchange C9orf72 homolog isoform X1 [Sarcophilus harrisii]XP_031799154.1 guanine nucleotide exchange C9orf72 homolog isoform X1 [Sarcophilus harrisii]XP_031799162.1 guanine nucleotide exchange C9orf72
MSTLCPPPSPAVAKTEIALSGDSPLLAATFAYWDNILGPRVRHIWAPKKQQLLLSDGEITFLANHTLNGEILRNAESGAIDVKFFVLSEKGVIIVSLIFDGNWNGDRSTYGLSIILPQTELSFYLPLHRVCVDRLTHIIRKGRIWMHKERQENVQKIVLEGTERMEDQGQSIIPMLTGEVILVMELLSSMKSHCVPEEIDISDTVLNDDDIGDSCHEGFLLNAISSHLQTCGCSIVVGSSADKVNKIVRTLCLFLTPSERKCSRLCRNESSFKYESGLFVQGLLKLYLPNSCSFFKDSTGSFVLPFRQVMYAPYPTTHIDVDVNTVKQMPPCHEHIYNQRRYMRSELTAFWRATSEEDVAQDTIIYTDESFTPDLNVFQDVLHRDTLVKAFLDQVFHLKPGLSLRSTFLAQFLLILHRKALTLIKYIEDDTQKGKKPFKSLRNLKIDLDLTAEGDLNIIMALAEKIKPGLHSFIFGRPFYTSVQERDVLMTF